MFTEYTLIFKISYSNVTVNTVTNFLTVFFVFFFFNLAILFE